MKNIFLMRGCLRGFTQTFPRAHPSLQLIESICFDSQRRRKSPQGVTDSLSDSFPSQSSLPGLSSRQYRNETLLNQQRTKEYIPHIPLGQAALHTGNSRLLYSCELTTNIILMSVYHTSKMHQFYRS